MGDATGLEVEVSDNARFRQLWEVATPEERKILKAAKLVQTARSSPAGFAQVASKGVWKMGPHLEIINRCLLEASRGQKFYIISVPPRMGKSMLASTYNPAWFIGANPDKRILILSYSADLAKQFGRASRDLVKEHGEKIFGVKVRSDSHAADDWGIEGHSGRVFSAGFDGTVTGKGGQLILVDDPHKSMDELASRSQREKFYDRWSNVIRSRLEPGGSIVVIQTRWAPGDLAGYLLKQRDEGLGDPWEEIRIPMLADTDDDPLGRAIGDPLWPYRYDLEACEQLKRSVSPMTWRSLYQQQPISQEHAMFPWEKWQYADAAPLGGVYVRRWDLAAGSSAESDFSAGVLMTLDKDGRTYIVDIKRTRTAPSETEDFVKAVAQEDTSKYPGVVTIIEQAAGAGAAVADYYVRRVLAGYNVRVKPSKGNKEDRSGPLAAQVGAGNVFLVRSDRDGKIVDPPWFGPFREEAMEFPGGENDDQIDAASLAYLDLTLDDSLRPKVASSKASFSSMAGRTSTYTR